MSTFDLDQVHASPAVSKPPQSEVTEGDLWYQFPQVIDSTILSCFDGCSQKFFHEYILCLAPTEVSVDLHAGGAFARAIEVARKAYWFDKLKPEAAVMQGFRAFIAQWGDFQEPEGHAKDFINVGGALYDYFRQYPLDQDPITPYIMAGNVPAIEFSFGIPLPIRHPISGDPLLYGGRIDMIGQYEKFLAVIDEKTTKSLGSSWEKKWKMRGQFMGYPWAAWEYGIPVQAAVIRGIAIQKTQYSHLQAVVQVHKWLVEEWRTAMLDKVQEMVDRFNAWRGKADPHMLGRTPWRKSFADACDSYGGCMFQDLCTSRDPEIWYSTFKRRIWNPLNRNPAGGA